MNEDKSLAFSLIELLVSMIIVSLIAGVFISTINKRLKSKDNKIKESISDDCDKKFSSDCTLCYPNTRCLVCILECDSTRRLNVANCRCE